MFQARSLKRVKRPRMDGGGKREERGTLTEMLKDKRHSFYGGSFFTATDSCWV